MIVLLDQGTPAPLRTHLNAHQVSTAFERGWNTLKNGDLLNAAESANIDVLVTTDQSMPQQQNIQGRSIAVVILDSTSWPRIQGRIKEITDAITAAQPGQFSVVSI